MTAVAWTQVALDTPRSQLATATPAGADTLAWRASLLVHEMATDDSTRELAHSLGIPQTELTVFDPLLAVPTVQTSMAMAAAQASLVAAPYTLEVFPADPSLPAITIEAAAPQASAAERLAMAAVAILKTQASPGGHFTSAIPTDADPLSKTLQPFEIKQVAPTQLKVFHGSTLKRRGVAGALLVFVLCCILGCQVARRLPPRRRAVAA